MPLRYLNYAIVAKTKNNVKNRKEYSKTRKLKVRILFRNCRLKATLKSIFLEDCPYGVHQIPATYVSDEWQVPGTLSPGMCTYEQPGEYPVRVVTGLRRVTVYWEVHSKSGDQVGYEVYPNKSSVFRLIGEFKFSFYFNCMAAIAYVIK